MGTSKTLGGERLGAGKKMKVDLHNYGRSTHDLGFIFRSSMSAGTLVPFMCKLGLPGDEWDIELNCDVKTLPTIGPMFGSMKVQLDVFQTPYRLYQALLHNNMLGVGMDMARVKLPLLSLNCKTLDFNSATPVEFQQINQSALLAYLGIRGVGKSNEVCGFVTREFNAIPLLAYWDIYKNYYANKQEEIGAFIHTGTPYSWKWQRIGYVTGGVQMWMEVFGSTSTLDRYINDGSELVIDVDKGSAGDENANNIEIYVSGDISAWQRPEQLGNVTVNTNYINFDRITIKLIGIGNINDNYIDMSDIGNILRFKEPIDIRETPIHIETFELSEIDNLRENILKQNKSVPFIVAADEQQAKPLNYPLTLMSNNQMATQFSQEGLGLKTYQSDIFNNWLNTEWIDGENGINMITAISTTEDYFTLDTLNLSKKVYEMLNRIAVSGGSYNDWLEAVYDQEQYGKAESPVYMGGLSKEIIFQEVVSTAEAGADNPLGTLGGKGKMSGKHKGGKINIKCSEPCVIMGIVSITPRIDYSQGNDFTVHLRTMDDLHKPALDEIGFQDLITEQMAFWDSEQVNGEWVQKSAGKQPAWLNYMTDINKCFGNFADPNKEMYMTLNRRYEYDSNGNIKDLTTYIDPSKYNYMFAQSSLDSQNFWTQIAVDAEVRRKMSAKVMPNL